MGFEKEQPPIYADKRRREKIRPDVSGRPGATGAPVSNLRPSAFIRGFTSDKH